MGGRGGGGGGHKLVEGSKLGGGAIVPGSGTNTSRAGTTETRVRSSAGTRV